MKTILRLSLLILLAFGFTSAPDKVYVCNSKTSVAYHASETCRGLKKCTHQVIHITKKEATDTYKKRACKICY